MSTKKNTERGSLLLLVGRQMKRESKKSKGGEVRRLKKSGQGEGTIKEIVKGANGRHQPAQMVNRRYFHLIIVGE